MKINNTNISDLVFFDNSNGFKYKNKFNTLSNG
jgi:hypothetical protein